MKIFAEESLDQYLKGQRECLRRDICKRDEQYILNVNETQFIQYLISEYSIEPLCIDFCAVSVTEGQKFVSASDHPSTFIFPFSNGVDRLVLTFHIPICGLHKLLWCWPSSRILWSGEISFREKEILYKIVCFNQDKDVVNREFSEFKGHVQKQLDNVNADVGLYNDSLQKCVADIFFLRKKELLKKNSFVESLGIPLKNNPNVPITFSVPIASPKKIRVMAPIVGLEPYSPDPIMDMQAFNEIMQTIHATGKQFERMPSTYSKKDEESLRDHILMMLEPCFEGTATGETFNKKGKTDILLRYKRSNLFVGECKFWSGKKGYHKTIDQILSYLTWRDSKAAVIMFVRNKEISPVLKTIEQETPNHSCFDLFVKCVDESWFDYNFHLPEDSNRSVKLAVLVFHIP